MDKNQLRMRFDVIFKTPTPLNEDAQQAIRIASANGIHYYAVLRLLVEVVEEELFQNLIIHPSEAILDALNIAKYLLKKDIDNINSVDDLYRTIMNGHN